MNRKFLVMFIILCFGSVSGLAQAAEKKTIPNGLVLKIVYFKGKPTSYQPVPDAGAKVGGAWYALFQQIPNWQPPAAALSVRAVNIISRIEGNAVKVNVSVFTGQRVYDKEEFVADYLIGENETIEVKELSKFGVVPFEITVVKVTPSVAALPAVDNKTASLEVASIEPNYSTLPSYKIKFLNNSSKAVSAFTFATFSGTRPVLSAMPQGLEGKPLIKSGETYEKIIPNALRLTKTPDEQIPAAIPNETFRINAVIFEDGTYEGEIRDAVTFLGFTLSRKSQLKQTVPLLLKASENDFVNGELSRQISNLVVVIDENDLNKVLERFPDWTERDKLGLRGAAGGGRDVKKTILDELKIFEVNQKKMEASAIQDWIKATKEKYQNWLARLL